MTRAVLIGLVLTLLVAVAAPPLGVSAAERSVAASVRACAARPVPLPPSRPVSSEVRRRIDARVQTWRENRSSRYPGLSAAIRWDDGRLLTTVSGVADRNSGRKVAAGTPFALASVSKPFTAAIALLLDACGLMPLDTQVASLVPYADVRADATIEDLLRHESGMSDWLTDKSWRMEWLIRHPNSGLGPKGSVQGLLPRGEIGDFDYSNSGFTLITLAAERATGTSWSELMQTLLLTPLQLKETGFGPVAGAARTHIWSRGAMRPFGNPGWGPTRSVASVLRGAGDLFSTPRDLVRFGELLWGNRLLEGVQTNAINGIANLTGLPWSYTLGSMMDRSWLGTLRTYGHTGGYSGVSSTLRRIPELGVTLAITANGMGVPGGYADDLAIELVELLDQPMPSSAASVTGQSGAGLRAAQRANPEPFPLVADASHDTCAPTTPSTAAQWLDLDSGASRDWSGGITTLAELPSGALLVAGEQLVRAGGVAVRGAALRDPRSGSWEPFASFVRADGSVADVHALTVDAQRGRLYVAGDFTAVLARGRRTNALGVAQLNLNTDRWSSVSGGLVVQRPVIRALDVSPSTGALVAVGTFGPAAQPGTFIGIHQPGEGWTNLNPRGATSITGVPESTGISESGAVTVSGNLRMGLSSVLVMRWTAAAGAWRVMATQSILGDAPHAIAVQPDGSVIVGTGVSWYGTAILRESALSGFGWESLGGGISDPRWPAWVSAMVTNHNGETIIGGAFQFAGGALAARVATWSPSTLRWSPIGAGLASEPDALASSSTTHAYAALRLRGTPGSAGARCITAFAPPAATTTPTPTVVARRKSLEVSWTTSIEPVHGGWIAKAQAGNGEVRSCEVHPTERACTISGLRPGVRYRVTLRSFSVPAGPSPESEEVVRSTVR